MTIAGSYHAGKFLRPHGKAGKVYFPEDGTVYFRPDASRYGAIKPIPNSLIASGEDVVGALAAQDRMAANVWLVLLHNTRLGAAHPNSTVENAFGDRYLYSLCPSAPDARAYAIGLAVDATESLPVAGGSLETPGFRRMRTAIITRLHSTAQNAGSMPNSGSASANIALRARNGPVSRWTCCADESPPTSRPTLRATSTFPPIWRKPSG